MKIGRNNNKVKKKNEIKLEVKREKNKSNIQPWKGKLSDLFVSNKANCEKSLVDFNIDDDSTTIDECDSIIE